MYPPSCFLCVSYFPHFNLTFLFQVPVPLWVLGSLGWGLLPSTAFSYLLINLVILPLSSSFISTCHFTPTTFLHCVRSLLKCPCVISLTLLVFPDDFHLGYQLTLQVWIFIKLRFPQIRGNLISFYFVKPPNCWSQ